MKFINSKICLTILAGMLSFTPISAQEIINDTVKKSTPRVTNTTNKLKIDGVVATVGDYLILDSDIDKGLLEIASAGNSIAGITRCEMLGKLMEDRLYAHHAVQDSLKLSNEEVYSMMDERINDFIENSRGSMSDLLKLYKKKSEAEFRDSFFELMKMNKLSSMMTNSIIEKVKITPDEVKTYFNKIPKDSLPVFGDEVEISQIIIKPKISDAEKQKIIDRLREFKADVLAGASFYSKAVLYSQDPGSKSNGGLIKVNRRSQLVKEFKDAAFSLQEGEISEPIETMYGYHLIYVEKVLGQNLDVRHILLMPKETEESLKAAKEELASIRQKIIDKEISFEDAARASSDEKETKANGGILINPNTFEKRFDLTKLDSRLYGQVANLQADEISLPLLDEDESGRKVYKIVTVTKRIPSHVADYVVDYTKIKDLALRNKQMKEIEKWAKSKISDTFIKVNGEYRDCNFKNNWLKK